VIEGGGDKPCAFRTYAALRRDRCDKSFFLGTSEVDKNVGSARVSHAVTNRNALFTAPLDHIMGGSLMRSSLSGDWESPCSGAQRLSRDRHWRPTLCPARPWCRVKRSAGSSSRPLMHAVLVAQFHRLVDLLQGFFTNVGQSSRLPHTQYQSGSRVKSKPHSAIVAKSNSS